MISREQLERWKEWTEAHAALMGIIGEYPSGDVLYIAAMPALLAEVEEQAKEIERLRAALDKALTVLHAYHDDHPEDFGASAHDALWAVEAAMTHTVDLSDSWHMSHAKCREAGRYARPSEPAKECEHMYPSNQGVPRCVRCGKEIGT